MPSDYMNALYHAFILCFHISSEDSSDDDHLLMEEMIKKDYAVRTKAFDFRSRRIRPTVRGNAIRPLGDLAY